MGLIYVDCKDHDQDKNSAWGNFAEKMLEFQPEIAAAAKLPFFAGYYPRHPYGDPVVPVSDRPATPSAAAAEPVPIRIV